MLDQGHLETRSDLLRRLREFFFDYNFLEVQTPLAAQEIIPELHIDPFLIAPSNKPDAIAGPPCFLQSSPELHMKRLLCAGAEAIFEVTWSFRVGESGKFHNPEFTIVEWYRTGDDMHAGMALLDELCQALLATPSAKRTTYAEAFQQRLNLCPHTCSIDTLASKANGANLDLPVGANRDDRDDWLNLLLATQIEPHLGSDRPEILYEYPTSQAALAKVRNDGIAPVAERFELYYHGIELANGYHELTDAAELRARLNRVNQDRLADNRQVLPMPESLLAAMEQGMPNCAGCALGFDRLLMLASGAETLREVL